MGLDATVYVHRDNLELMSDDDAVGVDEKTGEVYLEDPKLTKRYSESTFIAIHKRLGNVDTISYLRDEISKILSSKSILYSKVLYEGSHSGDVIGLGYLENLESEIKLIKEATHDNRSPLLEEFLRNMEDLIHTARTQKNPIVFI